MNFATFDLNLLRALDALLTEGSTVGAAKRLRLSQSAVSGALSRLRHALDAIGWWRRIMPPGSPDLCDRSLNGSK